MSSATDNVKKFIDTTVDCQLWLDQRRISSRGGISRLNRQLPIHPARERSSHRRSAELLFPGHLHQIHLAKREPIRAIPPWRNVALPFDYPRAGLRRLTKPIFAHGTYCSSSQKLLGRLLSPFNCLLNWIFSFLCLFIEAPSVFIEH